jgi:hypothetical protein
MKKVAKKKVTVKKEQKICVTCKYHVRSTADAMLGKCHRYPQISSAMINHWCGEHNEG